MRVTEEMSEPAPDVTIRASPAAETGRSGVGPGPASPVVIAETEREPLNAIHDWVRSSGWAVGDRGRLPSTVVEAYDAAHK